MEKLVILEFDGDLQQGAVVTLEIRGDGNRVLYIMGDLPDIISLTRRACDWMGDYLKTNPNISQSDLSLCDG